MRLTSPRWAHAASKLTGRGEQSATAEWLQSLSGRDPKRRDIINPELCDEALALLRPSLPKPATCDVIDINPGAGIWSQRLNAVLKPRRHVFVETEYGKYKDALAPLLRRRESSYRLAPTIRDALDEKQDFLSAQLRESYAPLQYDDSGKATKAPTSQLIITANLASRTVRSYGFKGQMSKLFFDHFYRNTMMNAGSFPWHKYGLVKLLAWVPEADKESFNPRCTTSRYRAAKRLEATCDIREIVASFPYDGSTSMQIPWYGAALKSMRGVAENQPEERIEIPLHRIQPSPKPPSIFLTPVEENFKLLQSLQGKPPLINQYISAYHALKRSDPEWLDQYLSKDAARPKINMMSPEDPRRKFAHYHIRMMTTHKRYAKVDDLAFTHVELERRLVEYRQAHPDNIAGYKQLLESFQPRFELLKKQRAKFFKDNRHAAMKAIDDYRAFNQSPHILNWNNRPFEPLLCRPKQDFYPHTAMTLMEVTPRPSLLNTINTGDLQIVWDYIDHTFDTAKTTSIKQAIEALVGDGEAYDLFVGKFGEPGGIPSLTDPLLGGSHDLSDVRLRTMTVRQLTDITLAYEKWPWRIAVKEMVGRITGARSVC